jgi:hypothetical protein
MPDCFAVLPNIKIGFSSNGVLQRVNPLATKTSMGCIRKCKFCAVPIIEPEFVELEDWPDLPIVCDNNLLACSQSHFDKVIDRLIKWKGVDFNQGLDARLLTDYHARRLSELKQPKIRLSCDSKKEIEQWNQAVDILLSNGVKKSWISTYVLIGYNSDPGEAQERINMVIKLTSRGAVYPQWFHSLDEMCINRVTAKQKGLGWTNEHRLKIMMSFYQAKFGGLRYAATGSQP